MHRFFKYQLRTTHVDAARAFYRSVLGYDDPTIVPLHEQALARGARPHWLGFLEVNEVETAAAAWSARGGTALGPKWINPEGLEAAPMRDAGGAILALAKPPSAGVTGSPFAVSWHLLSTTEVERAKTNYAEQFGFHFAPAVETNTGVTLHPFSYEQGGPNAGALCDIAGRQGVHAHWLFYLRVPSLDSALAAVTSGGGTVLGPFTLPSGETIAVCDDPQGAAFGLIT